MTWKVGEFGEPKLPAEKLHEGPTPRTDRIACRFPEGTGLDPNEANEQYNDLVDEARQLERELAQWKRDCFEQQARALNLEELLDTAQSASPPADKLNYMGKGKMIADQALYSFYSKERPSENLARENRHLSAMLKQAEQELENCRINYARETHDREAAHSAITVSDDTLRKLYYALDQACLMTGAWSDMSYADLPDHVVEQLKQVLAAIDRAAKREGRVKCDFPNCGKVSSRCEVCDCAKREGQDG